MKNAPFKKAMILSAGFGTRLMPLTEKMPKALVPYKGKPMLQNVIEKLIRSGINYIVINTHYLSGQIVDFIKANKFDAEIHVIYEKEILGTGGGLKNAEPYLYDVNEFLVYNVDVDCDIDLSDMYKRFYNIEPYALLAVQDKETKRHVLIDSDDRLIGRTVDNEDVIFYENHLMVKRTSFCGIHILSNRLFQLMPAEKNFDIILLYMKILKEGIPLFTYNLQQTYWNDLGSINSIKQ